MHKEYLYGQILRILFSSVSVTFGRGLSIHAAPVGTLTFGKAKFQFFFLKNSHLLQKLVCHPLLHSHSWAILCPVFSVFLCFPRVWDHVCVWCRSFFQLWSLALILRPGNKHGSFYGFILQPSFFPTWLKIYTHPHAHTVAPMWWSGHTSHSNALPFDLCTSPPVKKNVNIRFPHYWVYTLHSDTNT